MNYLATYLSHHHFEKIVLLSDEGSFAKDCNDIFKDTAVKEIHSLRSLSSDVIAHDDITDINADCLVLHNYFAEDGYLYSFLLRCKFDTAVLYYDDGSIDYFRAWESLRNNCNHITIVMEKKMRQREIVRWDAVPSGIELSVILPVYNVGKYIQKCIDTLTEWKAPYLEFIFVSDGSKDESVEIIKKAMENDQRIKLIEKENGGCASARQVGLEAARGNYIGFIDPDDFIDPSMYRELIARAILGNMDISFCGYNEYYEDTKRSKPVEDPIAYPTMYGLYTRKDIDPLISYLRIGIWRGIYRKKMIEDNNIHFYLDLPRFDDLPFKVETIAVATKVASVNKHLYYYRLNREGQDVSIDDQRLYVHFDIFKHLDVFFENRSEEQKKYYEIVKRDTHNWALTKLRKEFVEEYKAKMKEQG